MEGCLFWFILITFCCYVYCTTQNMWFVFLAIIGISASWIQFTPKKKEPLTKEELEECLKNIKNDDKGVSNMVNEMTKCPYCAEEIIAGAQKCKHCDEWLKNKPQTQAIRYRDDLPAEISGWNWGAFFLTWIWGIGNKSYISLWALIPFLNFIWMLVCGVKGNEWAWKNKQWSSIDEFHRVQRLWAKSAIIIFGSLIGILLILFIISIIEDSYL